MFASLVDTELREHLSAELVLREHSSDCFIESEIRFVLHKFTILGLFEAARISGVLIVDLLLEFSSSIMALILAGKVGSNIASEIGTMRVSEQIDAMEVMGVNSANYIILPKIMAMVTYIPLLSAFSMITGLGGAYFVALFTDIMPMSTLTYGFQAYFKEYYIWYALFKTLFFGFIISSVSSYYGYSVKGGSREVGRASTNAVVVSSVLVLITDVLLTQIIMA